MRSPTCDGMLGVCAACTASSGGRKRRAGSHARGAVPIAVPGSIDGAGPIEGRAWQLTRPRDAYAGTYTHPLLGDITVALDAQGAMVLRWGRLSAVATAYDRQDHVRVEFAANAGDVLAFLVRGDRIDALAFEGMTFTKGR
jgi:hypothetical protein